MAQEMQQQNASAKRHVKFTLTSGNELQMQPLRK